MTEGNYYHTIEKSTSASFTDRGSRFIAFAYAVDSIDAFKKRLTEVKALHPKSSHYCFAYRIGSDGMTFRATDAGEPSGSAGRPILGQIDSRGLTNTAVIVVRYFGGTLLGIPGLIHAYKTTASLALQLTPVMKKPVLVKYVLECDYTVINELLKTLRAYDCIIENQAMQLFCHYTVNVPLLHEQQVMGELGSIAGLVVKKMLT
ncbi:MAG: YigZ family protein [Bacteroidetes bacterium]|nr:YigZ family protein [Bacteroidota bacterium]